MRWADLDSLNHVNNVVYLRYAADARAAMSEALPTGSVRRTVIEFRRPILLGPEPVVVVSSVEGQTVHQGIGVQGTDDEFARVQVSYGDAAEPPAPREGIHTAPFALRDSDRGPSGEVSPAQIFELFQESRIPYISSILPQIAPGWFVVARVEVDQFRPVAVDDVPLESRAHVAHVGRSSYSIEAQLLDATGVLATSVSVLVGFDLSTQSSRQLSESERELLVAASTT